MQAIEFKTTIRNGTVTLPVEYTAQLEGKTIRIIVLDNSDAESTVPNRQFQAIALKTEGFKFDRTEAHGR